MMKNDKKKMYNYGGMANRSGMMGGGYRTEKAHGGKVYGTVRDMEKACMGPDYNESMKQK
jgi:hypothetical protein